MDYYVDKIVRGGTLDDSDRRKMRFYGYDYKLIEKEVNRRLGCPGRHDPYDFW
jgi:hypothetical protein